MKELICISCPNGCHLTVDEENGYHVSGAKCERGEEYGKNEILHPVRTVTSTVRISGAAYPRLPVKTDRPIDKDKIFAVMELLNEVDVCSPVAVGQVIVPDVFGTGVSIVACRSM